MIRVRQRQLVALAMTFCLTSSAWGDVVVRHDTPDVTVAFGDVFDLNIVADIDEPVLGWGLDLTIDDPSILSTIGDPLIGSLWDGAFAPDGDGLAALGFPDSIMGNDLLLATVTLSADTLGETDLFLGADDNGLTEGFPLDNVGFAGTTFEPGHVRVVPLPAAGVLVLVGLGVVTSVRRRSR